MEFSIKHETIIEIDDMPLEWLPLIALYDPALPQFPMHYVHILHDGIRVFGFLSDYNIVEMGNKSVKWQFRFLSNLSLEGVILDRVKTEIRHRLGIANPVCRHDIEESCSDDFQTILLQLWDSFVIPYYGEILPFGRFYDQMISLVRCAAALIPQSGQKSEYQMLYDFMRHYGVRVDIAPPWNFLEFFLLPTYDELMERNLVDFPSYSVLQNSIDKFAKLFFTDKLEVNGLILKTVGPKTTNMEGYNTKKAIGMRGLTLHLQQKGEFTIDEKRELDFLIDAFNRMAQRALGFIGLAVNVNPENNFAKWNSNLFKLFYKLAEKKRSVGIMPKIWGMILQQGFGNIDVVPIDTWIESFYENILQIPSKNEFLDNFKNIGKVERLIWLISQARKTNMNAMFDWLWCLKFGTGGTIKHLLTKVESRLRGPNPLSCLKCPIKGICKGYSSLKASTVHVIETSGEAIHESKIDCSDKSEFIVLTFNNIPKYVYKRINLAYQLVDGFTGLEIHDLVTSYCSESVETYKFMNDL